MTCDKIWMRLALVATLALAGACGAESGAPLGDSGAGAGSDGGLGGSTTGQQPALDFTAFDQELDAFVAEKGLAGATAAVVHKDMGVLHVQGYGGFDANRASLIASASKILSVGVLMRLADQQLLNVDEPVSTYLSAWGMHKMNISVAQMVSNSSGMKSLVEDPTYVPYLCQFLDTGTLSACAQSIYTAMDTADLIPPDTQFKYGGGQWQLAGGVAEVVSGKSWAQLVDETYVQPCGLTNTGYTNHFAKASAEGSNAYPSFFSGDTSTLPVTENPSVEGGAYTTAGDYAQILLMHLRGGLCGENRVLSEAAVARMQQDRIGMVYGGMTGTMGLQGYGMGWWVSRSTPGLVADPGLYGAHPWLDTQRGYGAIIIVEDESQTGGEARARTQPLLEALFDQPAGAAS